MKKLILHIGRAKTGTTAIQQFCNDHTNILASQGILYPQTGIFYGGHHPIAGALSGDAARWTKRVSDLEECIQTIIDECTHTGLDTVLLSSEGFQGRDISKLIRLLPEVSINVLMFVRRHDRFYESLVSQDIKVGLLNIVPSWTEGFYEMVLAHSSEANYFSTFLGREAIKVGLYEEGIDVVEKFASLLDISLPKEKRKTRGTESTNTGMSTTDIGACLLFNRLYPASKDRQAFVEALTTPSALEPADNQPRWWRAGMFLKMDEREKLLERMRFDVDALVEKFSFTPEDASQMAKVPEECLDACPPSSGAIFRRLGELAKTTSQIEALMNEGYRTFYRPFSYEEYSFGLEKIT
ncbi:hypothetical protein N2601_25050 (plasmid) [Rhizobium sp. CB3060]|uniref:hypothetical protein n=1 Tax=Rhizobium sp. CB3060 TaxID=3138255 RepID=UPI0021A97793|nr:hypothetical protein [Rhizobium tropici]UWU23533.1 hypothetical protein N2601_25050 [Rhizobium tropici]